MKQGPCIAYYILAFIFCTALGYQANVVQWKNCVLGYVAAWIRGVVALFSENCAEEYKYLGTCCCIMLTMVKSG